MTPTEWQHRVNEASTKGGPLQKIKEMNNFDKAFLDSLKREQERKLVTSYKEIP